MAIFISLSAHADTQADPVAAEAQLQTRLTEVIEVVGQKLRSIGFEVEFTEVDYPPGEEPVRLRPVIKAHSPLTIGIEVPKGGLKNAFLVAEVFAKLNRGPRFGISGNLTYQAADITRWFELSINTYTGSQAAKLQLESQTVQGFSFFSNHLVKIQPNSALSQHFKNYQKWRQMEDMPVDSREQLQGFEKRLSELLNAEAEVNKSALLAAAESELNARNKAWKQQKISADLNSWIKNDHKINDMLKANDRKGVRKLLEAFLPWPLMDDFERETWKVWLEAIEHPDSKNSIVMFRGTDAKDHPQYTTYQDKPSFGFFSTVLTRNQGNYTRRLLSLATRRQQEGLQAGVYSMAQAFRLHDDAPKASSFLSFTLSWQRAVGFSESKGGVVIAKIDRRRALPNAATSHPDEAELLVPLFVFPDEVIAYELRGDLNYDSMKSKVAARLKWLGIQAEPLIDVKPAFFDTTRDFIRDTAIRIRDRHRAAKAPPGSCRAIFSNVK